MENRLVNLKFPRGYVEMYFEDGKCLRVPVRLVPEIKRMSEKQRREWQILDGVGFTFKSSDTGFHLKQFGVQA